MPASSSGRNAKGSAGRTRSESSITAGATRSATCALEEIAISVASRILPPSRDHDRPAVLGGIADDRDDHHGDEELREADGLREPDERVHERSR